MAVTKQKQQLQKVDRFLDSFSSRYTMRHYNFLVSRFFLSNRTITADNVINYIVALKKEGKSYGYRSNILNALKYYGEMNDLPLLNWKKIRNYLGEPMTTFDLRGYTHQEIQRLLDVADPKYKAIILIYASTGMRREPLTQIKLKDMEYLEEHKLYKIKIYKGTKEQQICFTTSEAAAAIKLYFKLNNINENETNGYFHHVAPTAVSKQIGKLNVKAKMREVKEGITLGIHREETPSVHGFRKFAITQMKRAKVDTEIRKVLTGHSIGVASRYVEFTEDDLLQEYLKAVDLLTINEENKLRRQVETLTVQKSQMDKLQAQMQEIQMRLAGNAIH